MFDFSIAVRNICLVVCFLLPMSNVTATEQTPWQAGAGGWLMSNLNWPGYNTGYAFTVQTEGEVTALGGLFNGTKKVRLYNNAGQILAQAWVTGNNAWAYSQIPPVAVSAGNKYTVSVETGWGGSTMHYGMGFPSFPHVTGDISIDAAVFGFGPNKPSGELYGQMWGQADFVFTPATQSSPETLVVSGEFPESTIWIPAATVPPYQTSDVDVYLNITNNTSETVFYDFTSTQYFEIYIINYLGVEVVRWGDSQFFFPVLATLTLAPGESWRGGGAITLADSQGVPLAPGEYIIMIALNNGAPHDPETVSDEKKVTINWLN